ncbi:hypothetical protein HLB42_03360 [Deinococcus sp. D7000]|uniref:Uncharacterized protein n=1 Tax=Deinococcus radiopugnans ATCC 19172 TaxID=585398 RepID=A0A5C4Y355_9DEIO|nr:hypothetical protein HLB42_03360 [Deinococcus sp. D7000]TNM69832.1 hypothetical protein FHR04_14620 [Deinococcus radiopugnans ATCC 19172]
MASAQQAAHFQRRRVLEVRAREHVGAAGWAQSSMLEDIIRTGQQGLAATDALRQVISLTSEQIRALPLGASPDERDDQAQALMNIVENGEQQVTAAQALNALIGLALEDVARTPLNDLNVSRLHAIHERVAQQLEALDTIIGTAQAQAQTLTQAAQLEEVLAEHQRRLSELRRLSAEEEIQALTAAGEQIVERISALDDAGERQVDALTQIGKAVADHMSDTGASGEQQAEALEGLAHEMTDRAGELRDDGSADEAPPQT